jgi:nuclease HARBI1
MERQDFGANSILLGDGGYALTNYMLTPISHPRTAAEKKYQKSQIKTRNTVERLYGVWKRRFPTLSLGFRIKKEQVLICIVACAVLHNIAIDLKDDTDGFPDVDLGIIPVEPPTNSVISSRRNNLINNYFA